EENTTLFAYWQPIASGSKLPNPVVRVEGDKVIWEGIVGSVNYTLTVKRIIGEGEYEEVKNITDTSVSQNVGFSNLPAGDYEITLKANSSNTANSSETTIYYKNK